MFFCFTPHYRPMFDFMMAEALATTRASYGLNEMLGTRVASSLASFPVRHFRCSLSFGNFAAPRQTDEAPDLELDIASDNPLLETNPATMPHHGFGLGRIYRRRLRRTTSYAHPLARGRA